MIDLVDEFFNTGFEENAIVKDLAGVEKTVKVIFDEPFSLTEINGVNVQNINPKATVRSRDVQGIEQNWKFTIRGRSYIVTDYKPDSTGLTEIEFSYE